MSTNKASQARAAGLREDAKKLDPEAASEPRRFDVTKLYSYSGSFTVHVLLVIAIVVIATMTARDTPKIGDDRGGGSLSKVGKGIAYYPGAGPKAEPARDPSGETPAPDAPIVRVEPPPLQDTSLPTIKPDWEYKPLPPVQAGVLIDEGSAQQVHDIVAQGGGRLPGGDAGAPSEGMSGAESGAGEGAPGAGGRAPGDGRGERLGRWRITYTVQPLGEYVDMLDTFGAELGVVNGGGMTYSSQARPGGPAAAAPEAAEIVYAGQFGGARPQTRRGPVAREVRMYWQPEGGTSPAADFELLRRAGVEITSAIITFFPLEKEKEMSALERAYAASHGKSVKDVTCTLFQAQRGASGQWEIVVLDQKWQ